MSVKRNVTVPLGSSAIRQRLNDPVARSEAGYARAVQEDGESGAEPVGVAVVGAGQAGLATSRELSKAGVEHVVLERGRVGQTWRDRWDSFCLVTPNWTVRLPDGHYDGPHPDGFMPRDEI